MTFDGLSLSYFDRVVLAVRDVLDQDAWLRTAFGGRTLAGTADVSPGSDALVGTGTSWSTGDDSLGQGDRLVLGDQVAEVLEVAGDGAITLSTDHVDGLVGATIYKAARSARVQFAELPVDMAIPYYTVAAGVLPNLDAGIGRILSDPAAVVSFVFEAEPKALADDQASWTALAMEIVRVVTVDPKLQVPRFGNAQLARHWRDAAPGTVQIPRGEGFLEAPAVQLTWSGVDPIAAGQITQRW